MAAQQAEWLQGIREQGWRLADAPAEVQADPEVALAAVQRSGVALEFVAEALRGDHGVVLAAVQQAGLSATKFVAPRLWEDRDFVSAVVREDGRALELATEELRGDRDVATAACREAGIDAMGFVAAELWTDRDFVFALVEAEQCGEVDDFGGDEPQGQVDSSMLQSGLDVMKFASAEFWADHGIVLELVQQSGEALEFAAETLRADDAIVLAAVQQAGLHVLKFAVADLFSKRDFGLALVGLDGQGLKWLQEDLRGDPEVVLVAVQQSGPKVVDLAAESIWKDSGLVLSLVKEDAEVLHHALPREGGCRKEHSVVLAAVQLRGFALEYADCELCGDREIVLTAVQQDGNALMFASMELRADRDIVLAAVRQAAGAKVFAAAELRDDPEIVQAAAT